MNLWEKKKLIVIVFVVFALSGLSIWQSTPSKLEEGVMQSNEPVIVSETKGIKVYVSGEVENPGIYEIKPGSRADDAIEMAGGMTVKANVNKVNLAKKCKDGMQINVPAVSTKKISTKTAHSFPNMQNTSVDVKKSEDNIPTTVNINNADIDELVNLPGVGEATARKIVEYRQQHHFNKIEDIMNVKGIGKAKFLKMKNFLEV